VKTLELPDTLFDQFESFRRSRKLSREDAFKELIKHAEFRHYWLSRKPTKAAQTLSEAEIERLAVQGVREARAQQPKGK
jgi:hypothetical protein